MMNNRDYFQLLPEDILHNQIWPRVSHLDDNSLRQFRATSTTYYKIVQEYRPPARFYYAVGKPVMVYSQRNVLLDQFLNGGNGVAPQFNTFFASKRASFSHHEIRQSLYQENGSIRLFTHFSDASSYKYLASEKDFIKDLDAYHDYAIPAVYVIGVNNCLITKPATLNLKDGSTPIIVECLETPTENCEKIFFSKLMSSKVHFFTLNKDNFNEDFSELWNSAFERGFENINQAVSLAVSNLFNSCLDDWFSRFRSSHQEDVKFILESVKKDKSVDELYISLKNLRNAMKVRLDVNQQGRYCKRLDFAIARIKEIQQAAQLSDIEMYYKSGMRK